MYSCSYIYVNVNMNTDRLQYMQNRNHFYVFLKTIPCLPRVPITIVDNFLKIEPGTINQIQIVVDKFS